MGSTRTPSIAIPVDSDASPRKNTPETVTSPLVNGEKSIFRDQVRGYSALGSPLRREVGNRSITRSFCIDDTDLEDGKAEKDRDRPSHFLGLPKIQNQALLSGLAYCISSCSMILVNKYILSGYGFSAGIFLMLYQNIVSVTIVSTLSLSGVIPTEPLTWKLIKVWLPVNIIFVGMLITSMFSLKYINVAMLTILKNVANVLTASGETYFFKKQHDRQVWISLTLMIISAIAGGITDLSFNAIGYTWQILNCFLTASYSLTLRHVMDSAKQATKSGNLNELSMVLLNNILSVPLGIILVLGFNEVEYLFETPLLRMPMFWIVITASGVLGLAISFTSMWFLHQTSATTYRSLSLLLESFSSKCGRAWRILSAFCLVYWQEYSSPEPNCLITLSPSRRPSFIGYTRQNYSSQSDSEQDARSDYVPGKFVQM
ncbi:GDP-mannose transporter GONST1 isoform X1 [Oryza glaberrima]|uniref:GDP-mannose transporter GONST1 isoform X1 n=1 Tax=Oryza glaberrima TaxID=4538 RepID=UPI00224C6275|nr:GDP-mannose transporter GONST1 isoform X1 [Oryza glaberrima]